jgi:hypothetical protein
VILRFEAKPERGRQVGEQVAAGVAEWFRRVRSWLSALTLQDLNVEEPWTGVNATGEGLLLQGFDANNRSYTARMGETTFVLVQNPSVFVTAEVWRSALGNASLGKDLPVEHQLLVDARAASLRGNLRRAVLEAATAAEVTLTAVLDARLRVGNEPAVVQKLMRQNQGLSRRVDLCEQFGIRVPENVKSKLVRPRDHAIHGGVVPTVLEAGEAVGAAHEIVTTLNPLG